MGRKGGHQSSELQSRSQSQGGTWDLPDLLGMPRIFLNGWSDPTASSGAGWRVLQTAGMGNFTPLLQIFGLIGRIIRQKSRFMFFFLHVFVLSVHSWFFLFMQDIEHAFSISKRFDVFVSWKKNEAWRLQKTTTNLLFWISGEDAYVIGV